MSVNNTIIIELVAIKLDETTELIRNIGLVSFELIYFQNKYPKEGKPKLKGEGCKCSHYTLKIPWKVWQNSLGSTPLAPSSQTPTQAFKMVHMILCANTQY